MQTTSKTISNKLQNSSNIPKVNQAQRNTFSTESTDSIPLDFNFLEVPLLRPTERQVEAKENRQTENLRKFQNTNHKTLPSNTQEKISIEKNIGHILNELGEGQHLPSSIKGKMESVFGANFDHVKIHNNQNADALSKRYNAKAFTVSNHIAFQSGEFQPYSIMGQALIAHELAHTQQQKGAEQFDNTSNMNIEADAENSTAYFLKAIFNNRGRGLKFTLPKLKTGISIQRCSKTSEGEINTDRRDIAISNFRSNNDHLTSTQLDNIISGVNTHTADNVNLAVAFYDYYSSHEIEENSDLTENQYGTTRPSSDTEVNPSILSFVDTRLAAILLHEYTHTRHDTNMMGSRDYQEGGGYAVEYFFAERENDSERKIAILRLITSRGTLTIPQSHAALQREFKETYVPLKLLYEIIGGTNRHTSPVLDSITPDKARELSTELINTHEDSRSQQLQDVVEWCRNNILSEYSPI